MNKMNQTLLTIVLAIVIFAIPYTLYLMTLQHDAKMDYYVIECHKAYQLYDAFQSAANPFMNRMIIKHKGDIK